MARRFTHLVTLLLLFDVCTNARAQQAAPPPRRRRRGRRDSRFRKRPSNGSSRRSSRSRSRRAASSKPYLKRIQAYNGTCVNEPQGILGPITTIAACQADQRAVDAEPAAGGRANVGLRRAQGAQHDRHGRQRGDMPDALETAAAQDQQFARTGRLVGPLHGVVIAIKDQYDTFDMRTTSGADADYANDRPPDDATFVKRLRDAGAIILAKANLAEYAVDGARSSFGGTFCNPYDTEREPGMSSAGSATAVAANLVTCAIGEETVVSVRWPASVNSMVGLAPTQELVSRDGMMGAGLNMRVGPDLPNRGGHGEDARRVSPGYDPKDELTVFSVGRKPSTAVRELRSGATLDGRAHRRRARIHATVRCSTKADEESIGLVERAIGDLRKLGAAIVDPGPEGELFHSCITRYAPELLNSAFARQYPQLFPVDAVGQPAGRSDRDAARTAAGSVARAGRSCRCARLTQADSARRAKAST